MMQWCYASSPFGIQSAYVYHHHLDLDYIPISLEYGNTANSIPMETGKAATQFSSETADEKYWSEPVNRIYQARVPIIIVAFGSPAVDNLMWELIN